MSTKIIQDRFDSYRAGSRQEAENALAEIAQEIALVGLARADFFKRAIFQGGTALRIFYGMQRFSEDLDFILDRPDPSFSLDAYMKGLVTEFKAYNIEISIQDRSKIGQTVKKAFLKTDSMGRLITLSRVSPDGRPKSVRIKFEVDTNPPRDSGSETKYLDFPYPFPVTVQDMPSLFAGKSHALLCRQYTKGRDWFDFVFYAGKKTPINFKFLSNAINQNGPWQDLGVDVTKEWYLREMEKKIESVDWNDARQDVSRFLKPDDLPIVDFWDAKYFFTLLGRLRDSL